MRGRNRPSPRPSPKAEGERLLESTQHHSTGTASAQRQKALATGPVSASRTKIGANAIAQPPARRQRNATRLMEANMITLHMKTEFVSAVVLLLLGGIRAFVEGLK